MPALSPHDEAHVWRVPQLDLNLLRANFVTHSFKRHMHDYFVIGMIEAGVQQFTYQRDLYTTLPAGVIVINPGEPHTGEAAAEMGFRYRALYPQPEMMQHIASDITGKQQDIPFFAAPVIHDADLFAVIQRLHQHLENAESALEQESRFVWALSQLVMRHADNRLHPLKQHREKQEIKRIQRHLEMYFAEDVPLKDLAALVNWNPFYLLRAFRAETGLPPHAYLASIRIREAQKMLKSGASLARIALETGFNSQSHFTTTFRQIIGVPPGHYAQQVNF